MANQLDNNQPGNHEAMYSLGRIYDGNQYGLHDEVKAIRWYNRALAHGNWNALKSILALKIVKDFEDALLQPDDQLIDRRAQQLSQQGIDRYIIEWLKVKDFWLIRK